MVPFNFPWRDENLKADGHKSAHSHEAHCQMTSYKIHLTQIYDKKSEWLNPYSTDATGFIIYKM